MQRELLHSGVRQYIHRMIICLGDELLKYVPMAISLMLKDCKVRKVGYDSIFCTKIIIAFSLETCRTSYL